MSDSSELEMPYSEIAVLYEIILNREFLKRRSVGEIYHIEFMEE